MKNRHFLPIVASPFLSFLAEGAVAQEAPVFEEILVTAEKRTESLQNLSQAVTALTAEDVENRQLSSFVDLSAIAPGVNVAKNEGFKTALVQNSSGQIYIMVVDKDSLGEFERYCTMEKQQVLEWLDERKTK